MAIDWKAAFSGIKQQEKDQIQNTMLSVWQPLLPELDPGRCAQVVAGIVNDVFAALETLKEMHDDF